MKIALGQINPTVGDITGNVALMIDICREAKSKGASLVIFPELAVCGYPPMDLLLQESFIQENLDGLQKLAAETMDLAVVVGYVDRNTGAGRPIHNSAALIENTKIVLRQHKTLLPTYDVFDEDRYFEPAREYGTAIVQGRRIALSVCEDLWNFSGVATTATRYHADPIERLAALKPQLVINISCSPFGVGKYALRERIVKHHAETHNLPIIYLNQVGGNDQLVFDGRSIAVSGSGSLVARAAAFKDELLILEWLEDGSLKGTIAESVETGVAEIYEALVLGTRDYIQKCHFKQVVIGLSGGIDSAVTCAIAQAAVGKENILGVAMPSPFSSPGSIADAKSLAENLGVRLALVPINDAMTALEKTLAEEFSGLPRDVAEENLQARLRGTILMAISNKHGQIVLTTGNKSELAVGYCTLYGDMCGGLAVISDVPKMQVYALANYINTKAERVVIPLATIEKPPSAELKLNQTDQDTLPPYPILDAIIEAYVERRLKPEEIMKLGFAPNMVADVVERIDRNEYKRKQAAPGLKISDIAFGTGWRMPIAQGFKAHFQTKATTFVK